MERSTLISKLFNQISSKNVDNIYPAPPKQSLKMDTFYRNIFIKNLIFK